MYTNSCNLITCPAAPFTTCVIESEGYHPALEAVTVAKIKRRPAFKWGITGMSLLLPMKLHINLYLSQPATIYPFYQVYQPPFD